MSDLNRLVNEEFSVLFSGYSSVIALEQNIITIQCIKV